MRYMPILRVQQSEYIALSTLDDDVSAQLVPLLYQTPSGDDPDPESVAYRRLDQLAKYWSGTSFYDPRLATSYDGLDARTLYNAATLRGPFAPVVPLSVEWAHQAAEAAAEHRRAMIRIDDPLVVLEPHLEDQIEDLLAVLALPAEDVTLVFDLGVSTDPRSAHALLRFPLLDQWADVVLAAGAFEPASQPTETSIPRAHLENWRQVAGASPRQVVLGDYGTLEPIYYPPVSFPPAAKLTYTEPTSWFYVRGTSIVRDGNEQIFGLAQRVTESSYWRGPEYSWGDEWIADRAAGRGSPGNAGMWIRAALSHHLTHVIREDV